jgi:hypothetical protein
MVQAEEWLKIIPRQHKDEEAATLMDHCCLRDGSYDSFFVQK